MPYEIPQNPGMPESYVLQQLDTIYGMAWLTPWVIEDFNLLLGTEKCVIHLNRIFVPIRHRGRKYGHILMNRIVRDADRYGVVLTLDVQPDVDSDYKWIHLMYEHTGFSDVPDIGGMVRWPR